MDFKIQTKSMTYAAANRYVNKIGLHHFAHLRALAEGVDVAESAERYLGTEHGNEARAATLQTIDAIRAISRRRGDKGWRLIGITIQIKQIKGRPTFEQFMAEKGMDDWPESEVALHYEEAYPSDPKATHRTARRIEIIKLLREIEVAAAEIPRTTDLVTGWFDERTAKKLLGAGIINLGQLQSKIAIGGRWHHNLAAIGRAKAQRISSHLNRLLTLSPPAALFTFTLGAMDLSLLNFISSLSKTLEPTAEIITLHEIEAQSQKSGIVTAEPLENEMIVKEQVEIVRFLRSMISSKNDAEAAILWVQVKAGSSITATTYIREAIRLLLWLKYERNGKTIADFNVDDCLAFMTFLQKIPSKWMSLKHASPFSPGWGPFRGQISQPSYRQTIIIIGAFFRFLDAAKHIHGNPWELVSKKIGPKRKKSVLDTKALSTNSMTQVLSFLDTLPPSPALSRFRFVLIFTSTVGLRSAELLSTQLKNFMLLEDGWMLNVVGKGEKERDVAIPDVAFTALETYLKERGCTGIEYATSELPLIARLSDGRKSITYQALYKSMKAWFAHTINGSNLDSNEKKKLGGATTHWLRHTFGTNAVARGVPHDVIKDQMGHSSIETVANIYGKAPIKRMNEEMAKAFG